MLDTGPKMEARVQIWKPCPILAKFQNSITAESDTPTTPNHDGNIEHPRPHQCTP
jgi:hypothetical protein